LSNIYTLPDGTQLTGGPFMLADGTKFPSNWLDSATAGDLLRYGITSTVAPPPSLAQVKVAQMSSLQAGYALQVAAGFTSTALGTSCTYSSTVDVQGHLTASVVVSLLPNLSTSWVAPFWCTNGSGILALRDHTALQIQQVGKDAKSAVIAAQQKYASLRNAVATAVDVPTVQAIVWT
jgi:hypothetical protein